MKYANAIIILVALTVGSLFFTVSADAHPHHGSPQVSTSQTDNIHGVTAPLSVSSSVLETVVMNKESHHVSGGIVCQYGCCAGACAACCVVIQGMASTDGKMLSSSNDDPLRNYVAPYDLLNLPDTPPPRA